MPTAPPARPESLVDDRASPDRGALTALLRHVGISARDDGDVPFDPDTAFDGLTVTAEQEARVVERGTTARRS